MRTVLQVIIDTNEEPDDVEKCAIHANIFAAIHAAILEGQITVDGSNTVLNRIEVCRTDIISKKVWENPLGV